MTAPKDLFGQRKGVLLELFYCSQGKIMMKNKMKKKMKLWMTQLSSSGSHSRSCLDSFPVDEDNMLMNINNTNTIIQYPKYPKTRTQVGN